MSTLSINMANLSLDATEEDLQARQRLERKAHQAQVQSLKKSADKGDKKRKREVLQEIANLEAALEKRHDEEQLQFVTAQSRVVVDADHADEEHATKQTEFISQPPANDDQPQRVSKAQKRRDKKVAADRQLQADILAQEELNKTGARTVESNAIRTALRARKLILHEVPSDGDCLYNAIAQQLVHTGRTSRNVADLRSATADYIEAERDALIVYMTNPRTGDCLNEVEFVQYCAAVRGTPAWGGQLEIKALSNALRVPIEVLQASGPPTVQDEGDFGGAPLVLTYHRHMYSLGEHYNATRRCGDGGVAGDADESSDEGQASK